MLGLQFDRWSLIGFYADDEADFFFRESSALSNIGEWYADAGGDVNRPP